MMAKDQTMLFSKFIHAVRNISLCTGLFILSACSLNTEKLTSTQEPSSRMPELAVSLNDPSGRVMVAAHRGCWKNAPENSLAALEACIALGVDIVEVDLRLTKDDVLVVLHDRTLKRMTGLDRAVEDVTLSEIRDLRLRNRNGRDGNTFTDEIIPTFDEYVAANNRRVLLILDFKGDVPAIASAAESVLRQARSCDLAMFALVAGPDEVRGLAGPLLQCARYLPNLRVPMGPMGKVARSYQAFSPVAVAVRFDDWRYLEEGADDVRAIGSRLWVNTLSDYHAGGLTDADALEDPDILWGRLIDNGVNMIQTDEPEALINYLPSRKDRIFIE